MTPLTHIERHIFDAALRGEPVRRPTMADAAKYEVDARRLASEPLPHVAGGVSARQITGKNAGSDAHTEAHEGVPLQTGAGFNHSAPIFAGAHWLVVAFGSCGVFWAALERRMFYSEHMRNDAFIFRISRV